MEMKLEPKYDSKASFYGKAKVRTENGKKLILRSYSTDVAYIENGKAHVNGLYSETTTRHIKEFLKQHGFKAESGTQMMNDYGDKAERKEIRSILNSRIKQEKIAKDFIENHKEE